jgi:hypothetical protein
METPYRPHHDSFPEGEGIGAKTVSQSDDAALSQTRVDLRPRSLYTAAQTPGSGQCREARARSSNIEGDDDVR